MARRGRDAKLKGDEMIELRTAPTTGFKLECEIAGLRHYVSPSGASITFRQYELRYRKGNATVWLPTADSTPEYITALQDEDDWQAMNNRVPMPDQLAFQRAPGKPLTDEDEWIECLYDESATAILASALYLQREAAFETWQDEDEDYMTVLALGELCYVCALYDKVKAQLTRLS